MKAEPSNQYIYIVQSSKEQSVCKIGKTNDLERRLSDYNNQTGKSKDNVYNYLFTCEVADMTAVEKDIKAEFPKFREQKSREIYFFNNDLFADYVNFIKSHKLFVKEIFIKTEEPKVEKVIKVVKKTTPSLKERGITAKDVMDEAKKAKDDEFYTRYEDIEKEVSMYDKEIWKNKVVFCNCDDAVDDTDDRNSSSFALFFMHNFNKLGLKKLICTHYGGGLDIFNQGVQGYVAYISVTTDGEHIHKEFPKNYNGSFDHPISLKILNEEADIVCTNPPFSRAADYWKIVIRSRKKFLIISNHTNVKNDAYIPYFIKKQVWAGYNEVLWYNNSKKQLAKASGYWFTNFPVQNRPKYKNLKIVPLKEIPEKYKKYDDSKTLLVDNCYIPSNVKKPFAVSVYPIVSGILEKGYKIVQEKQYRPFINGKEIFARVLIQKI
ncbi:MAG: GIY-YIG nuclease family protein [Bacteroidales bacterium]|jgi:predicted GIY-YIG superfamily endonuclease|nr:GIY-YIG nuclease family protein [Bacteroidales bacterium]